MGKTLGQMTDEIREINIVKGWRPAEGGPGERTWGDYWALVNTEIAGMTEAYRDHRLADATKPYDNMDSDTDEVKPAKPEGVGSEMADVLIRVLDTADVFGIRIERDLELGDLASVPGAHNGSFGYQVSWLHWKAGQCWIVGSDDLDSVPHLLRALVTVARNYQIDLESEYERKIAFNRTRPFRHGGRVM